MDIRAITKAFNLYSIEGEQLAIEIYNNGLTGLTFNQVQAALDASTDETEFLLVIAEAS